MPRRPRLAILSLGLAVLAAAGPAHAQDDESFLPGLRFNGFGQVGYAAAWDLAGDLRGEDHNGFSSGVIDLFLASRVSERMSFLGEILLGADPRMSRGNGSVMRLILRYDLHPRWNVQAGRLYTSLGYWNERFHHGSWLQTSIGRPAIYGFGGERSMVLPVHLVGVSLRGAVDAPGAELLLTAEIGNGRPAAPGGSPSIGDSDPTKALNLSVVARPAAWSGLRLGGGVYVDHRDAVDDDGSGSTFDAFDEQIGHAHVVFEGRNWEFLAEFVHIRHEAESRCSDSQGWYLQLARRFGRWTPYTRFDVVELAETDPYYQSRSDHRAVEGGLRWDVSEFDAIKLQVGYDQQEDPVAGADQRTLTVRVENAFAF